MNVLFFDWNNYGKLDIINTIKSLGHTVTVKHFDMDNRRKDSQFVNILSDYINSNDFDCLFSINYYPVVSIACENTGLKYISWVYDSPLVSLYSYTVINTCNYIFIFDSQLAQELISSGIKTIHYLPLGINDKRLAPLKSINSYDYDISFVGSLYNEQKHNLFERLSNVSDYTKGYLDGIMNAQQKIYGYYFIEELLNDRVLNDLRSAYDVPPNSDGVETYAYAYAYYFIARKITSNERLDVLNMLSHKYNVHLFTHNKTPNLPSVINHGEVDYYSQMPVIFRRSKVNLNITLRSIRTGIPLRALDIMGSGGFLLSNFQSDFSDYYEEGTDYIMYNDTEDLLTKCEYYLSHDMEREEIADNGMRKTFLTCSYSERIKSIFKICFN